MQSKSKKIKVIKSALIGLLWVTYMYVVLIFGTLGVWYYVQDITPIGWNQILRN